jgi:ribonuclease T2
MRYFCCLVLALMLSNAARMPVVVAAPVCAIPTTLSRPEAVRSRPEETNIVPVTGHVLALSWSPEFCRDHRDDPRQVTQCQSATPFGFILHGLWPEGAPNRDPAFCGPAKPLSVDQVRANFCMMPSPNLQQHEWAKHGTCVSDDPAKYFKAASILYNAMQVPDMDALSRRGTTVSAFVAQFAALNVGLPRAAIMVDTGQGGWLKEVRICLGTDFRPRACPGKMSRQRADRALKIWRAVK